VPKLIHLLSAGITIDGFNCALELTWPCRTGY
jgi:hypothetical protein